MNKWMQRQEGLEGIVIELVEGSKIEFTNRLIKFGINTATSFDLEKAGGKLMGFIESHDFKNVTVKNSLDDNQVALLMNGMKLREWKFEKYKTQKKWDGGLFIEHKDSQAVMKEFNNLWKVSEMILWAREMINTPANDCYAEKIVEEFNKLGMKNAEVVILGKEKMEQMGMNLALKVNQGSPRKPAVIVIKKGKNPELAIVGKGVTFDTGGVSIKPSNKMDEMIYDMAGGAAVLATAKALDETDCEFIAIAGFVENCCDGKAQLPGDIYKSKNGKTVQVLNTDAEGRLLLGDLVYYAGELGCKDILTIATLTGAVQVALGNIHAGIMGKFSKELIECGKKTGETLWELPSDSSYDSLLESKVADLQNISNSSGAGTITGFKFIEYLLKEGTSLTHMDIAAVIRNGYAHKEICDPSFYTAFGVRVLTEFIKSYGNS